MTTAVLARLGVLSELGAPPAAALPDALDLVDQAVPGLGSILLWQGTTRALSGGYANLKDPVDTLSCWAELGTSSRLAAQLRLGRKAPAGAEGQTPVVTQSARRWRHTAIYRTLLEPYGVAEFVQVALRHQGECQGTLILCRGSSGPAFHQAELDWLASAALHLGAILAQRPRTDIPSAEVEAPSTSTVDRKGVVLASTPTFREHLIMLHQSQARAGRARTQAELPDVLKQRCMEVRTRPEPLCMDTTWGRFHVFLQPLESQDQTAVIVQRLVPVTLKMFRVLQPFALSERQLQTACGLAAGASFNDLAESWGVSRHSVITHAGNLYDRLAVDNKQVLLQHYLWDRTSAAARI